MPKLSFGWLWGKSIRWQLICCVAIVHALLMAIFVVGQVQRQKDFLLTKARQRTEFQARLLAASSEHHVLTHDLAALSEVLANVAEDRDVRYAIITEPDGHILADTDRTKLGLFLTDAGSIAVLGGPPAVSLVSETAHTMAVAAPMTINGRVVGWSWVARDLTDDRQHIQEVVTGGLAYTLVAVSVGTLLAMLLAGAILRPLKLLLLGADRLARDQLDEPVPVTTQNEVGSLTTTFNRAMAKLAEQRDALRREVDERTRAKQEAEEANRAKDQFLAVLSHELRTPLTPVLTLAQMLEGDPDLSPETRDDISTIRRNVELEAHLIDDLLDLTRISRGKVELRLTTVDLHEKLRQVARMVESESRAKRIDVSLELWAAHTKIFADVARIQQVFWNLLKNAIKFTPPLGRIAIQTHNEQHDPPKISNGFADAAPQSAPSEDLIIEVVDTGIGMEASVLPKVFDAFEQGGREVTRAFGGLGLGLTISKALVDLHGGSIKAQSQGTNRGATFRVCLPVGMMAAKASAIEKETASQAATSVSGKLKRRILLVEDHPDTARATVRLLTSYGYFVGTADTVESAIRQTRTGHFDLIVSDIGLPDGSGHDLVRQLVSEAMSHGERLKSIALSGLGGDDDLRRSREAGFIEHLTKPVDPKILIEAVDHALEKTS